MSESILKRTANWFTVEGYVSEKCSFVKGTGRVPMFIEHDYVMDEYDDGEKTGRKIKCDRLLGAVTIRTTDGTFEININATSKNMNGEDNKRWTMFAKIADWNSEIGGNGETADYVTMSGSVSSRDYVGRDNAVHSQLVYNAASKCERITPNFEESGLTFSGTCYVASINNETRRKGDDVEETGRVRVNSFGVDYKGQLFPINFIVEGEDAVDFINDDVTVGDTLSIKLARECRFIQRQPKGNTFRKLKVDTNSNFTIDELLLAFAEVIYEPDELEDDEGNPIDTNWLNPVVVKKAIKVRNAMLDELLKNDNGNSTSIEKPKSMKERKAERKTREIASPVIDDDDSPFDDEDSFDDDDDEF